MADVVTLDDQLEGRVPVVDPETNLPVVTDRTPEGTPPPPAPEQKPEETAQPSAEPKKLILPSMQEKKEEAKVETPAPVAEEPKEPAPQPVEEPSTIPASRLRDYAQRLREERRARYKVEQELEQAKLAASRSVAPAAPPQPAPPVLDPQQLAEQLVNDPRGAVGAVLGYVDTRLKTQEQQFEMARRGDRVEQYLQDMLGDEWDDPEVQQDLARHIANHGGKYRPDYMTVVRQALDDYWIERDPKGAIEAMREMYLESSNGVPAQPGSSTASPPTRPVSTVEKAAVQRLPTGGAALNPNTLKESDFDTMSDADFDKYSKLAMNGQITVLKGQ